MVEVQLSGTGTKCGLEILYQCDKEQKLKVRKFQGLILTFAEVTEEKLVGLRLLCFCSVTGILKKQVVQKPDWF